MRAPRSNLDGMATLLPLIDDAVEGLNTELGGKVLFLPGLSFGEVHSEEHRIRSWDNERTSGSAS